MDNVIYDVEDAKDGNSWIGFKCPGCGSHHAIRVRGKPPVWSFNCDYKLPTLSPSVRVRWSDPDGPMVCHFFIRQGKIEFCADSTHKYAGKTVPMNKVD